MTLIRTAEFFDMTPFLTAAELPKDPSTGNPMIQKVITRGSGEIWQSRAEPLRDAPDGPLAWIKVRDGELVRIPLLPYRMQPGLENVALGAMDVVQQYIHQLPTVLHTHIVIGKPFEDKGEYTRSWIGFAAQVTSL
jgi:hypothetical protein